MTTRKFSYVVQSNFDGEWLDSSVEFDDAPSAQKRLATKNEMRNAVEHRIVLRETIISTTDMVID